ncbi:MAG: hypothetical protein AB1333_04455 [Patescibacteria group bacterium]
MENEKTKTNTGIEARKIGILGLVLNSFGAIISAMSFIGGDGRITSEISGIDYRIAHISELGFQIGLFFMIFGFVLQIIEKINRKNEVSIGVIIFSFITTALIYITGITIIPRILFI